MINFTYWKDGDFWIGYLNEYQDYQTQGESLQELEENLKDIYKEVSSGVIPHVRKIGALTI